MPKLFYAAALGALLATAMPYNPGFAQTGAAQEAKDNKDAKKEAKPKRSIGAGLKAYHERQKKCGAEWRAAKAAGKIEKNQTWPKFLSECNTRLKAAST